MSAQPPQHPAVGTRLIEYSDERQTLTDHRETDARTALTRGLAEYIGKLSIQWGGGRVSSFQKVYETWAEPEDEMVFPAAIVYSLDTGDYESDRLSPNVERVEGGNHVRKVAEFGIRLTVEVWASDPQERMALVAMLEDAFDPVEWMAGFRLALPHYHGQHATYEKLSMGYDDDLDSAQMRWRRAVFVLKGNVTQIRRLGRKIPRLDVRTPVEVVEPSPDDQNEVLS